MQRFVGHSRFYAVTLGVLLACGCWASAQTGSREGEPPSGEAWIPEIRSPQFFAVRVEEVDRSVDWYCKTFGLRKLDGSGADDGSWEIANLMNDDLFVEIIRDDRATVAERARGFAKVGFRVPDVDVVADRVAEALGRRPRVLDFPQHGVRILQLRDPDENVIQLSSPLE